MKRAEDSLPGALATVRRDAALAERYRGYFEITGFDRARVPGLVGLATDARGNALVFEHEGARGCEGVTGSRAWVERISEQLRATGFPAAGLLADAAEDEARRLEGIVVRVTDGEEPCVVRAPFGIDDADPGTGIIDYKAGTRDRPTAAACATGASGVGSTAAAAAPPRQEMAFPMAAEENPPEGRAAAKPGGWGERIKADQGKRRRRDEVPHEPPRPRAGPDERLDGEPPRRRAETTPDSAPDSGSPLSWLKAKNRQQWSVVNAAAQPGRRRDDGD